MLLPTSAHPDLAFISLYFGCFVLLCHPPCPVTLPYDVHHVGLEWACAWTLSDHWGSLVQVGRMRGRVGKMVPRFSPGMFLSPFSFACILLGVGGRVRSSLCSQMATVIVDYALQLYLSCFREKNNK